MRSRLSIPWLAALATSAAFAVPAQAAVRPMWLGMEEPSLIGSRASFGSELGVDTAITDRIESAGVRFQRVALSWTDRAHTEPADPTDPFDPAYDFTYADDAIRAAAADWINDKTGAPTGAGLEVLLVVETAPDWAQEPGRPACDPGKPADPNAEFCRYPGTWRPKPAAVAALAQALATRYDGNERYNAYNRRLPQVSYFQVWNEPNLSTHLTPQRQGRSYVADDIYRSMLASFRQGLVASGRTDTVMVAAGLSPFGKVPAVRDAAAPQDFARALMCLQIKTSYTTRVENRRVKKRVRKGRRWVTVWVTERVRVKVPVKSTVAIPNCPTADFDVWAQHPYDIQGYPDREPDYDGRRGVVADLPAFRRILDTATRLGTITPAGRKPFWITEFDWWTNPPNRLLGKPPATAARWTTETIHIAWKSGAEALFWFRMRDSNSWPGGLWFASQNVTPVMLTRSIIAADRPKPGLANFRWPMLVTTGSKPYAWGIVPCREEAVEVSIEQSVKGVWRQVATTTTSPSGTFLAWLPTRGGGVGVWRAVAPTECGSASPIWNTQG